MGNFYLYAASLFAHWWPLVSAGSLFGVEEFASRYWPWLKEHLDKLPPKAKRVTLNAALVSAGLYSGFLAWNDEHNKLEVALSQASTGGSTIVISRIEPNLTNGTMHTFKVTFDNRGTIDAEYPIMFMRAVFASATFDGAVEDEAVKSVEKEAQNTKYIPRGNQVTVGSEVWFTFGLQISDDLFKAIQKGEKRLGFIILLKYSDASIPKDHVRYTSFCGYLIDMGTGGWNYCHSYNSTYLAPS